MKNCIHKIEIGVGIWLNVCYPIPDRQEVWFLTTVAAASYQLSLQEVCSTTMTGVPQGHTWCRHRLFHSLLAQPSLTDRRYSYWQLRQLPAISYLYRKSVQPLWLGCHRATHDVDTDYFTVSLHSHPWQTGGIVTDNCGSCQLSAIFTGSLFNHYDWSDTEPHMM